MASLTTDSFGNDPYSIVKGVAGLPTTGLTPGVAKEKKMRTKERNEKIAEVGAKALEKTAADAHAAIFQASREYDKKCEEYSAKLAKAGLLGRISLSFQAPTKPKSYITVEGENATPPSTPEKNRLSTPITPGSNVLNFAEDTDSSSNSLVSRIVSFIAAPFRWIADLFKKIFKTGSVKREVTIVDPKDTENHRSTAAHSKAQSKA